MRIKEVMKEKGVSLTQLAKALGKSDSGMWQIVNNDNTPPKTLRSIAKELHCDITEFFLDEVSTPVQTPFPQQTPVVQQPVMSCPIPETEVDGFVEVSGKVFRIKSIADMEKVLRMVKPVQKRQKKVSDHEATLWNAITEASI